MNILFVVGTFPTYSQTFIVNQIYDFKKSGHNVFIYSYHRGDTNISNEQINALSENIIYHNKEYKTRQQRYSQFIRLLLKFGLSYWFKFLCNPLKFYSKPLLLLENKINIIHCHFGDIAVNFYDEYLYNGSFSKSKAVCTFHGYDMESKDIDTNKIRYKNIKKRFNLFTYNTPYLGKIVEKCLGNSINNLELPVGLNINFLSKFSDKKTPNKHLEIIFCGRLIELKGVKLLPQIVKKLSEQTKNFRLTIIGDGDLKNWLLDEIKKQGIENFVNFLGARNQDEVFKQMNTADVFILPGIYDPKTQRAETQGLVIQEAQFFQTPVIVSDAGGMKYGLKDGITGKVVKAGAVEEFVKELLYCTKNKQELNTMGKAAKEFVINNYNIINLNNKLITHINTISLE